MSGQSKEDIEILLKKVKRQLARRGMVTFVPKPKFDLVATVVNPQRCGTCGNMYKGECQTCEGEDHAS